MPFLTDSSSFNRTLTAVGGAVSSNEGMFGSSLDNRAVANSGISIPDAADIYIGANSAPFCVECWVQFSTVAFCEFVSQWGTSNFGWKFGYSGTNIVFNYSLTGTTTGGTVAIAWTPKPGFWYHVAANRIAGNTLSIYVNGVNVVGAVVSGATFFNSTANLIIGNLAASNSPVNGWVDEVRISNVDRYGAVASFTPPTAPFTSDANTLLLAHFGDDVAPPSVTTARLSQMALEVLRLPTAVNAQLSQMAIEVLRPNVALAPVPTGDQVQRYNVNG